MKKFVETAWETIEIVNTFTRNDLNRFFSRSHVSKLKTQLKENLEVMPPVIVNILTHHIIDGQHRVEAFKALAVEEPTIRLHVMYVEIDPEEERDEIINANTHSKNWSIDDFIESYVREGLRSYVVLKEFCMNSPLTHKNGKPKFRYAAAIIAGKNCSKELKDKTFTFTDAQLSEAVRICYELENIRTTLEKPVMGADIEAMAVAWHSVRGLHESAQWLSMFRRKKKSLIKKPATKIAEWKEIFSSVHTSIDMANRS